MSELFPASWPWRKLGELFRIETKGCVPANSPRESYRHYSLPAFDETGGPLIEKGQSIESNKLLLTEPCVLVSKLNPRIPRVVIHRPAGDGLTACSSTEFIPYIPRSKKTVLKFYLLYFVSEDFCKRLERVATGTTNSHVRLRPHETLNWEIPSPPEGAQRAIAHILNAVDEAIERTRTASEKAQRLKRSLMQVLLTHGTKRGTLTQTRAGKLTTRWRCERLGVYIDEGPTNGLYRPESDYGHDGTPIVRIDSFADGLVHDLKSLRRVRLSRDDVIRYALTERDILINRVNSLSHIGKSAIVPALVEATVFESNMMRLRVKPELLPEFLILFLCFERARAFWLSRAKPAVNQSSINQKDVRQLSIPIPSPDEQREIVDIAVAHTRLIDVEVERCRALERLKRGLMQDLLTGKRRVPVDT